MFFSMKLLLILSFLLSGVFMGRGWAGSEILRTICMGRVLNFIIQNRTARAGTCTELNRKGADTHGSVHGYPHFVKCFNVYKIYILEIEVIL